MLSVDDTGPVAPCPAPFNLAAYVLARAAEFPDKIALEVVGKTAEDVTRWSYAELDRAVAGVATGLKERGLTPGNRVLIRIGNHVEFPIAYLGAIHAGLVAIPSSAQLTAPEVTRIAALSGPAVILAEDGIALPDDCDAPVVGLAELDEMMRLPASDPDLGDPNRLAYIIFTSGTSGQPKGVCHAHRAIWARRMMWQGWYDLSPQDRLLHAGAFNWTYTLGTGLMDPWSIGATALIAAPGTQPQDLPELIERCDVTIFAAAPSVYRQMLKSDAAISAPKLRHGLSAGEKLPAAVAEKWQAATGCTLHEALGMSEVSTFVSGAPTHPAEPGSSGFAQTGRKIAVLGGNGQPVARGEPGILAVATTDPGLMLGYLDGTGPTGDWFETGDTVSMSETGAITYLGRGDDMMNAGGFRVSPLEVERAFADMAGLEEAGCAAVRIKAETDVIALFYTGPETLPEEDLCAHAQGRLARYKQPRLYIHLPAMPKGPNGKLNRRILRETFEAKS
ncbi:MAG: acyl--CoA ligase [Litoreibacter sp.]|nr:acyl--CoA ligase [Litoreibacter sp.]